MHFAYPQSRVFLLLAFAVAMLAIFALVRKRRALRRLAQHGIQQPGMLVRPSRQIFKCGLMILAAGLLGIAVLGPQWGWTEEEIAPRKGREVLILLDVSRSMLAEDVMPNRLQRAKADLRDLAGFLERAGGYRIGLIAFAERTAVLCPLTADYRCFEEELEAASLNSLRIRGQAAWGDGTQIRLALERAGQIIGDANAAYTDVLLVSDGEDMAHETLTAAESLARRGVTVHALGVGDPSHDSPIPVHDSLGRPAHLRYRGELVHTHLQEAVLRAIAERTHGRYFIAGTSYRDFDSQFGELLAGKQRLDRQTIHRQRRGIHRFNWFVMPALLLLLLQGFLSDARRPGYAASERPNYFSWVRRRTAVSQGSSLLLAALFCIVAGSLAINAGPAKVSDPRQAFVSGNELLRQAQQAGSNADPATLLQAQRQYQACLSNQESISDSGSLFVNARHNLEMAKLLLLQINSSDPNTDKPDSNEPASHAPNQEASGSSAKDELTSKEQRPQQQSQEKQENCAMCLNGQNESDNARKVKEGGHGSGPGKGTLSASGKKTEDRTQKTQSTTDSNSPHGNEPGSTRADANKEDNRHTNGSGPEPDASGLFHAETPAAKQDQQPPTRKSQGDSSNSGIGRGKTTRQTDPIMQAAAQRLQESIQRIEKRRGQGGIGPESSPEDPANQNRYRDW